MVIPVKIIIFKLILINPMSEIIKTVFTYAEIKAEMVQLLKPEKFQKWKNDSDEKTNDLRSIFCAFAYKVWGLGIKHNISAVEVLNYDQQSLACEKSFLQALTIDKQQLQTIITEKDKKIQQLTKIIQSSKQHISMLDQEQQAAAQKIKILCEVYQQAKILYSEQIRNMKTQSINLENTSHLNTEEKLGQLPQITYKLYLAQKYISQVEVKFTQQNNLITQLQKKHKKLQTENTCLRIELNGLQRKTQILENSNQQKRTKIEQLLKIIETNQIKTNQ